MVEALHSARVSHIMLARVAVRLVSRTRVRNRYRQETQLHGSYTPLSPAEDAGRPVLIEQVRGRASWSMH